MLRAAGNQSLIVTMALTAILLCSAVLAQRAASSFKPGDEVEVKEGLNWRKGKVTGVNRSSGWVEVQLEDSGDRSARSKFATGLRNRPYPPDWVRRPAASVEKSERTYASRTWTDRTGKFTVEARFDRVDGANVVLTRTDGKQLQVPLEKLSDQDTGYVRGVSEAAGNPFEESKAIVTVAPKQANWRETKTIRPQTFSKWSFSPPAAERQLGANRPTADDCHVELVELPDSKTIFEKFNGVHVSDDGRRAVVCRSRGAVQDSGELYVESIDLLNKTSAGLIPLPPQSMLLDALLDENLIMYRSDQFGFGNNGQLTVARLEKHGIAPIVQWEPYGHEQFEPRRDVEKAWFLNSDRVLTFNRQGNALTVWDIAAAKAATNIPISDSITLKVFLSPDRRLLAVIMKQGIALIDLAASRHVATIAANDASYETIAFREDNARLAGLSDRGLTIWDLNTGAVQREIGHSVLNARATIAWADDFVLVNGKYMFDPDRRVLLWEYLQSGNQVAELTVIRRGLLCVVNKDIANNISSLSAASIPHMGARDEAKRLPSAEELLIVKPGDAVAIEIDVEPGIASADEIRTWFTSQSQEKSSRDAERSKIVVLNPNGEENELIRRSLTNALEAAGLRVADKSDLVVKAVCKQQSSQEVAINADGRWPVRRQDIVRRTITPHASYLELSLRGDAIWKKGYIARPGHVFFVERGESLDAALTRLTRPNLDVFRNAKFSSYFARPGAASENGAYGVSQLTPNGIVDGSPTGGNGQSF
jgi:WD40 repeat protein